MKVLLSLLTFCLLWISQPRQAAGFSLLGPFVDQAHNAADPWHGRPYGGRPGGLGYSLSGDIGGPMLLDESYRWNVPIINYGFDPSFVDYFGQEGVDEVEKAIAILNQLPPASEMNLADFPLHTEVGGGDPVFNRIDLKSYALVLLLEQMGLANPERFVWALRNRHATSTATNYTVLNLNYDPLTFMPSAYVNGVRYNYAVVDGIGPTANIWSSAVEWFDFDPLVLPYSSVAGGLNNPDLQLASNPFTYGYARTLVDKAFGGLTRDDAGGLKYLLSFETRRVETLLPDVKSADPSNTNLVRSAKRPGVEKITFTRQQYDAATSEFIPATNIYQDVYFVNEQTRTQLLQRVIASPDILFTARELGGSIFRYQSETLFSAYLIERSGTSNWVNHADLNGKTGGAGPGVIGGGAQVTFAKLGRYLASDNYGPKWGAMDDEDSWRILYGNDPVVQGYVVQQQMVRTDGATEVEWIMLKNSYTPYRVESSTNLIDWTTFTIIEPFSGGNAFTLRHPVVGSQRYFRMIRED